MCAIVESNNTHFSCVFCFSIVTGKNHSEYTALSNDVSSQKEPSFFFFVTTVDTVNKQICVILQLRILLRIASGPIFYVCALLIPCSQRILAHH